ncbi:MAG: hypothetical protein WCT14_21325 [Treponemataceae bacterium]
MKTIKEQKTDFQDFIDGIPDYLETIERLLNVTDLTFSSEEIDSVRVFYETAWKDPVKLGLSKEELAQAFCAYAGEAFIHHCRGNWELSKLKTDEAYGTPIILNWSNAGKPTARISPWVWRKLIERGQLREKLSDKVLQTTRRRTGS